MGRKKGSKNKPKIIKKVRKTKQIKQAKKPEPKQPQIIKPKPIPKVEFKYPISLIKKIVKDECANYKSGDNCLSGRPCCLYVEPPRECKYFGGMLEHFVQVRKQ